MAQDGQQESGIVLYAALLANLGIAVAKFVAAAITGSSSMMSEGFHSVVDSGNQVLLLYGRHRAKKPPDHQHPFGYGRELYFWSFVVAILIFAIGAGVSAFEGYRHIVHPEEMTSATLNYVVLAVSAALEGTSWAIAIREFARSKGDAGWWQTPLFEYAVFAMVIYSRAAAERLGMPVGEVARRIAFRHDLELGTAG